jgi:hypothetical protein
MSRPTEHDVFRALKLWPGDVTKQESYLRMCVAMREPLAIHQPPAMLPSYFPKSSGIPSTARAILDIVPERKTPPVTPAQQQQGEGVARAVNRLNGGYEPRMGFHEYHP